MSILTEKCWKINVHGWGWGWLDQTEIRLTQPLVELEAWAELGKKDSNSIYGQRLYLVKTLNVKLLSLPNQVRKGQEN